MRAASPEELRENALPVFTADISEEELYRWFPAKFQEITDPWAGAEPSKGALLALNSGDYFVIYWGEDSGHLTVRIAPSVDASSFLASFFHEVPLPPARIRWVRDGAELPVPAKTLISFA